MVTWGGTYTAQRHARRQKAAPPQQQLYFGCLQRLQHQGTLVPAVASAGGGNAEAMAVRAHPLTQYLAWPYAMDMREDEASAPNDAPRGMPYLHSMHVIVVHGVAHSAQHQRMQLLHAAMACS
jgi:hypothetical protein